jgi:prophage regulatory protein
MSESRIMRLQAVCAHTGLSRTTMYRLVRQGQFPKPIRLTTRTSGWLYDEVNAWIAERATKSRAKSRPSEKGVAA